MTGVFGTAGGYHALTTCDTLLLLAAISRGGSFIPKARLSSRWISTARIAGRHPVNIGVVGDIAPTLDALLPRITAHKDRAILDDALAREAKAEARLEKRAVAGSGPVHPQYWTEMIARHAAADAVFTADGGSPMVWCLRHIPATGRNRTIASLSHGTMANAMPQALGAQPAYTGRQVISLSGDGGPAMLMAELNTAVTNKLPVKIILLKNNNLAEVRFEQTEIGNPVFGCDLQPIDFVASPRRAAPMASAAAGRTRCVRRSRQPSVRPGAALVEAFVDPEERPAKPEELKV